jgi:hypothetical protein
MAIANMKFRETGNELGRGYLMPKRLIFTIRSYIILLQIHLQANQAPLAIGTSGSSYQPRLNAFSMEGMSTRQHSPTTLHHIYADGAQSFASYRQCLNLRGGQA